ncbi:MAG: phage tail tape measure protein [Oscillospiraceae bacterium]|nr:phage tail tape measure protein [Oscillospiraceae bacterium]
MAQKEYGIDFVLRAKADSNLVAEFNKARSEFQQLGNQVKELNALQKDISAYQKQQQAVQNTGAKLQNLQQQYALVQQEIKETNGSTTALEREKLKLEQQINATSTALENQKSRLETLSQKLTSAGVNTDQLDEKSRQLAAELEEVKSKQNAAGNSAKEHGEKLKEAGDEADDFGSRASAAVEAVADAIAAAGIAKALGEIKDAYMACVEIAGGLEQEMSNVEALSGATSEELTELTALAKQLGASTIYTATEAASAMSYMAMAGWSAEEMLEGMDGVIQLAATSGEALSEVSDIVTDNLTAFGLSASDTAHFSDVLAAAATHSNTNLASRGETFKNRASIAGALGYSIEDISVAVGIMANAGVKGSRAGTALKNTLNGLISGVTLTSDAFGEYDFTAVKADGTMKTFAETIAELREQFSQMSEAEVISNAINIAGSRTYNGLVAILNATDEEYASLTETINNCSGAAATMAGIKLDNMNGELTLMKSAWDALKTSIGEEFTPDMRTLYSVGTDVFNLLDDFVQQNPALVRSGAAAAGTFLTITTAVTGLNAAMKAFKALNAAGILTGTAGVVGALAAGMVALGVAAKTAYDEFYADVESFEELTEAAQELRDTLNSVESELADTEEQTLATAQAAEKYIEKLQGMEAATEIGSEYQNTLAILQQLLPDTVEAIDKFSDSYGRTIYTLRETPQAVAESVEAWKQAAVAAAYQEQYTELAEKYAAALVGQQQNTITLAKATDDYNDALERRNGIQSQMSAIESELAEQLRKKGVRELELDATVKTTLSNGVADASEEYLKLQAELDETDVALAVAKKQIDNCKQAQTTFADATSDAETALEQYAEGMNALTETADPIADMMDELTLSLAELEQAYDEAYAAALESIQGQFDLWDTAEREVTSLTSLQTALDSQMTYWQEYKENLELLGEEADSIDGLRDVVTELADGSAEGRAAIAGLAAALQSGDTTALESYISAYRELNALEEEAANAQFGVTDNTPAQAAALAQEYAAAFAGLDLTDTSADGYAAAKTTLEGFMQAAEDSEDEISEAYAAVAEAALNALNQTYVNKLGASAMTEEELQTYLSLLSSGYEPVTSLQAADLEKLSSEYAELVEGFNLSDVSYDAATDTFTALVTAANDMNDTVTAAWAGVGQSAADALKQAIANGLSESVMTAGEVQVYFNLINSGYTPDNAYATGTDSAARGFALVGERGPEIAWFNGGETVMDAEETRKLLALWREAGDVNAYADGTGSVTVWEAAQPAAEQRIEISYSPTYNITSEGGAEELRDTLDEHDAQLRDFILRTVAEAAADAGRRAYR